MLSEIPLHLVGRLAPGQALGRATSWEVWVTKDYRHAQASASSAEDSDSPPGKTSVGTSVGTTSSG